MGFSGYFLIVWDFINWAKEHGIPVGPGRGSGAGSAVAWAMRITDIDPIEFKLLFERFLNPERVSMPDFDVDFCMNRRGEVIKYVQEKYGKDRVGQIATFHQLKARGVIRDIARAMEIPFAEADKLAKLVPEPVQGKSPPVREAIEQTAELKQLYNESPLHRELLDLAASLEGLNRNAGMHAAGIVIAERSAVGVRAVLPRPERRDRHAVRDERGREGRVGQVRLPRPQDAHRDPDRGEADQPAAPARRRVRYRFHSDRDDADVYKMISRGDTTGVFQFESSGFREMLKKLKPDCLEDIVAAGALYRPGPLEGGMVDQYIDVKHGREKADYMHPSLEPVLRDTHGVIVYQEQVMQIAQVLAGYTLGGADLLRRAMGKKKAEEMQKEKGKFLDGAKAMKVDVKRAEEIFDLVEKFAGYGFNRSHSAAYGWITYQTAYLKHHYPHEFMAGLMSCDADNIDNVVKFIAEARAMGLVVERPDVNESHLDFTVTPATADKVKVIRFGMGAVKGVGTNAVEAIIEARAADGKFESLYELCRRVDTQKCNRRVLEQLIKSGAFDSALPMAGAAPSRAAARGARWRDRARRLGAARSAQWPDLAVRPDGATEARGSVVARGHPGRDLPRGRGVVAEAAARVREGSARLLRLGPSARSLSRRPHALRDRDARASSSAGDQERRRALGRRHRQPVPRDDHEEGRQDGPLPARGRRGLARGDRVPEDVREGPPRAGQRRADPVLGRGQERGHRRMRPSGRCCSRRPIRCRRSARPRPSRVDIHLDADSLDARPGRRAQDDPGECATRCTPAGRALEGRPTGRSGHRAARCVGCVTDRRSVDASSSGCSAIASRPWRNGFSRSSFFVARRIAQSKMPAEGMTSKAAWLIAIGVAACAMGGSTQQQQQRRGRNHVDGTDTVHDSSMTTGDAKVFHDAPVSHLDRVRSARCAAHRRGGICVDNTTCAATLCCYFFTCAAGTPLGDNICIPD